MIDLNNDAIRMLTNTIERDIESRNRVDIPLKDYEDMKSYIEDLVKENEQLSNKLDILEDILRRCQLPVDVIREGKVKEVERFEDYDPISMDLSYMIKLTVAGEDVR